MYRDNEPLAESTSNPPNTEAIQKCQTRNSLFDLKDVFTSRNELNLGLLIKSSDFLNLTYLNFTGVASVTDFTFYTLSNIFNKDEYKNKLSISNFQIKDCPHLSIWTLHYLKKLSNKSIFDLDYSASLVESIAGCDSINKDLVLSLECKETEIAKYHDEKLRKEAKVVVINENSKSSGLEVFKKDTTTSSPFRYARVEAENQAFNFYECWESLADSFLTERCIVIITFDPKDTEEAIRNGITRRLFQVFCKNIIPASIMIQSIEHVEVEILQRVKNLIEQNLKQTKEKLLGYVADTDLSSMPFQLQKEMSSHVNMAEQINLFVPLINYSSIEPSNKLGAQISVVKSEHKLQILSIMLENVYDELRILNKSDIVQLKALRSPPSAVQSVAEAVCYLFSKPANYQSFVKLVNTTDFLNEIKTFDKNSVSEYTIKKLHNYVSDANFNFEYVAQVSRISGVLCQWVRVMFHYGLVANPSLVAEFDLKDPKFIKNYADVLEYVSQNAFFGFELNMFGLKYGYDSYLNLSTAQEFMKHIERTGDVENLANIKRVTLLTQSVNMKLGQVQFAKEKLVKKSDILEPIAIETDVVLNDSVKDKYTLADFFLKTKLYQGAFHVDDVNQDGEEKFVITDLNWYSDVIRLISTANGASKAAKHEMVRAFDPDTPLWTREDLKSKLEKLADSKLATEKLIQHLISSNLLFEPSPGLLVSSFLYSKSEDRKKKEWPKKWEKSFETKYEWEITGLSSYLTMSKQLAITFYDSGKTVAIWSDGIINRESGADVFVRLNESKIRLTVRAFDLQAMFNLKELESAQFGFIKSLVFKYYAYILYYLTVNSAVFKQSKRTSSDEVVQSSKDIYKEQLEYFDDKFLLWHSTKNETSSCQDCLETNDRIRSLRHAANWLFPVYTLNLLRYDTDKDLTNGLIYPSGKSSETYESKLAMNTNDFSSCELRILHEQINDYEVTIEMRLASLQNEKMSINLSQNKIKIGSTKLRAKFSEDYGFFKIQVGNVYRLELNQQDAQTNDLVLKLNNVEAARLKIQGSGVYVAFKFDKINPESPIPYPNLCMCSVPLSHKVVYNQEYETLKESVVRNQFSLSSLIDMRLEAKDRKNTFICAAATITEVKEDEKQILIHFDGWTKLYDYWCSWDDPDIYPCGFFTYMIQAKKVPHREMKQLDPPKGMDRYNFSWEDYLNSVPARAVPFEFFDTKKLEGMTIEHYRNNVYSDYNCCNRFNPKKRFDQVKNLFSSNNNVWSLLSTYLSTPDSNKLVTRGLALLPVNQTDIEQFNEHELHSNGFYFASGIFRLFFTCFSSTPALLSGTAYDEDLVSLHLLDVKPVNININILQKSEVLATLITSYGLANCQNELILSSQVSNEKKQADLLTLSKTLKSYFNQLFMCLAYMFIQQDFENSNYYEIERLIADLPEGEREVMHKELDEYNDEKHGSLNCMCLTSLDSNSERYAAMPTHKYAKSCLKFTYKNENSERSEENAFELNRKLVENYSYVRSISLIDTQVKLDKSIEELAHLKYLELVRNGLTEIPKNVYLCKGLEYLIIEDNPIVGLSEHDTFVKLVKLKKLVITNVKFDPARNRVVPLPGSLEELYCQGVASEIIPFDFKLCSSNLKKITFTGFKLINLDDLGGPNAYLSLHNLRSELVTESEVISVSDVDQLLLKFDNDGSGYLEGEEIIHLNAHLFKSFDRLGFKKSKDQTTLGGLPNDLFNLSALVELDLSYQAIRFIPDQIEKLKSLKTLRLNHCLLLQSLSGKCGLLDLQELELDDCISLKTPPPEVVKRGFNSLMTYLRRLNTGSVLCKKTKLMLVGLGEAGKTSLLNSLSYTGDHESPQLTDGINIRDWSIDLPDNSQLTFSMWDFAGQSVYYNTHQFFLSSRAVYLLVWNVRLGSEYAGLEFWLSSIACHAPGAPIFVVGTHVDQVAKYALDEEDLKSRFKQIAGFHFVSSVTKQGIDELKEKIVQTTLQEKYIGEKIPAVWLKFETMIKQKASESPIVSFEALKLEGEKAGIIDDQELVQTIRFLSDLGAVQYFELSDLRDYVIINPQWIVDAFASLVSVKETVVQDGKLTLSDIANVWSKYDSSLHDWMLKLTEKFDLTFSLPEKKLSIIPCLLPEKEAKFEWPAIEENSLVKVKDFKVLYKFVYVPSGLFNRIQVRLYQYADDSAIWKHGSYLKKNNHIALLLNMTKNSTFEVKIQGVKPENIAFLIHEVIETLISEKFNLKYDFSFPCPECVEVQTTDPGMFSASLLRRAHELKVPYVQCQKLFHAVSIQELLAVMPIEGLSNIDLNLEYSLCDLKRLKTNLKYDVAFWFCPSDVPDSDTPTDSINPMKVIKAIKDQNYRVWYPKSDKEIKMDKVTYAIKESKMVILGMSDSCMEDEKSIQVFELVKTVIRKNYLIIEFGKLGTHKWLEYPLFASVCTDVRVIMQDPKRYSAKIAEVMDNIELQIKDVKSDVNLDERQPDVFLSYCWANSQEAVSKGTKATPTSIGWLDPRKLVSFFEENGIKVWLDIFNASSTSNGGLFGEITRGLNQSKVVVACLSNEYVNSKNCTLEFRFAHTSLKLPIVKAIVGQGDEWKKHELSFLAGIYPEVNFQYQNPDAYSKLLSLVQTELEKIKKTSVSGTKTTEVKSSSEKIKAAENNLTAFQELYELTQRKFLKQIIQYCDKQASNRPFPRLFCADLIDLIQIKKANETSPEEGEDKTEPKEIEKRQLVCIKPMCEYEEGWHLSDYYMKLENNEIPSQYCSYLARIMNILKNGNLATQLLMLTSSEGQKYLNLIESNSLNQEQDSIFDSYSALRKKFQTELNEGRVYAVSNENAKEENKEYSSSVGLDLIRCEIKNGKTLWLCEKHLRAVNARPLTDDLDSVNSTTMDQLRSKLLEEIEKPIN